MNDYIFQFRVDTVIHPYPQQMDFAIFEIKDAQRNLQRCFIYQYFASIPNSF